MKKIKIYHLTKPMTAQQAAEFAVDLNANIKPPLIPPLGGQSNGFFFFTTYESACNHAEFQQETQSLTTQSDKNLYMITSNVDISDIKYPNWQLDYEATKDYFFKIFFNRANIAPIKFDDVIISVKDNTLQIQDGKKFMKLRNFKPEHSGLIEKIVTYLYNNESVFRQKYNELFTDIVNGRGDNFSIFAIKAKQCPILCSCEKIENKISPVKTSQINKYCSKYSRHR